jgi:hypothetical protein
MKKLQLIVFFLLLFCACHDSLDKSVDKAKEFEGLITYKITYENFPEDHSYGDTMKIWYSKGNMLKLYNGKVSGGLRKEVFLVRGNKYFFQVGNSDSLFSGDIGNDKITKLLNSHHLFTDTRILGHTCEQIDQELEFIDSHAPIASTFMYSKDILPVDQNRFKGWKFASFDHYMEEAGVLYLSFKGTTHYADRDGISSHTFTAVKILEQPVDQSIFEVDTSKVRPYPM